MRALAIALGSILLTLAPEASAVVQPDGTTIPQGAGLAGLFQSRGEAIDAVGDAAVTPETFIPSCGLTFTVLQRNAGYQNSFGWYNVTGQPPQLADLHEFLACTDAVGTSKVLDIKNDPAYLGGEIGFYEGVGNCASPGNYLYVFYSQSEYNPDSSQANPYVHLLIYNSTVTAKAFYFGWEDLISGGDNDFDDLTTFVTGITCSGGGGPCDTGQLGVCKDGTLQCQSGVVSCVQSSQPGQEKCDGLDNDCNGAVDDGDLCADIELCDKGSCVPKCGSGEFTCAPGKVCAPSGLCVDPACLPIECPEGKKCEAGQCVGPCDGVVCPAGQVCRIGACVDPCAAITCDSGQVCVDGSCTDNCNCTGCSADKTCQPDGRCTFTACAGKTCNPGEVCDATGTCQDACAGATCPAGQECSAGQCVDKPAGTGGAGGGVIISTGGSGGTTGAGGGHGGSPSGGAGGNSAGGDGGGGSGDSGGCGCGVIGREGAGAGAMIAMAVAALMAARRRRR